MLSISRLKNNLYHIKIHGNKKVFIENLREVSGDEIFLTIEDARKWESN